MKTPAAAPCDFLAWDTDFFQRRIARVRGDTLVEQQLSQIDEWCRDAEVRCLYFLARADDPVTIQTAEEGGFRLVDVRVTFEHPAAEPARRHPTGEKPTAVIREFCREDLVGLQILARTMYAHTRFFNDGHFSRERAEALYSTWITRECDGRAQKVFVAVSTSNQPLGYVSCHLDPKRGTGEIGLVGVSREARGRSLGQSLVLAALAWFWEQGARNVIVVSQGGNVAAQRLYQRCGFRLRDIQLWYHKWYSPRKAGAGAGPQLAGAASGSGSSRRAVSGKKRG